MLRRHKFTHIVHIDREYFRSNKQVVPSDQQKNFEGAESIDDPAVEFETLDLNFGHPYSMTVLPNLYRAVKFLEKALENSGRVFIIDETGNEKAVTILIAFIMYKFRVKFVDSFQIMRRVCTLNVVLGRFLIAQLMEYEPILETQRRTQLGSSCSSEIRSSRLKRKKNSSSEQSTILRSPSPINSVCSNVNNNNFKVNSLNAVGNSSSISANIIITSSSMIDTTYIGDFNGISLTFEQQKMEI